MKQLSFALLLSTLFLACKSTSPFPLNKDWQLAELKYKPVPSYVKITLRFESGGKRYKGNNSCNTYSGASEINGPSLKFGPAISTKMYCANVADWETAYMDILAKVDNYAYRDDQLKLFAGTKIVAIFK